MKRDGEHGSEIALCGILLSYDLHEKCRRRLDDPRYEKMLEYSNVELGKRNIHK